MVVLAAVAGCPAPEPSAGATNGGSGEGTSEVVDTGAPEPAGTTGGSGADSTTGAGPTTGAAPEASTGTTAGEESTGGAEPEEAWAPKPCPEIYAQDRLPTFELELTPAELEAIEEEWVIGDDNNTPEHPLTSFKYEDTVITDASVRLRGNSSHWPDQKKMQFEVSFNTYDKKGRFQGLKRVLFDAAEYNRSFLRDRLALAILRDVGLAAPCANNARIVLNGEYYGLFTNIEKVDSEFLERHFEAPNGNLYKRGGSGWTRKSNKEDEDESDVAALDAAKDLDALLAVMNLDQAILEWAAEAVIPNRDGAWAGGLNLYVYNDPKTGFNVIPWDLDDTFTRLEPDTDPLTYEKPMSHGRPFYDIAMADPVWFEKYIAAIGFVVTHGYDPAVLLERIDAWSAQIATAAAEDPNKPFTTQEHLKKLKDKREFVAARAAFLHTWLECWQSGPCGPP